MCDLKVYGEKGYVSALKDGYKRAKVRMSPQLLEDLEGMLLGEEFMVTMRTLIIRFVLSALCRI